MFAFEGLELGMFTLLLLSMPPAARARYVLRCFRPRPAGEATLCRPSGCYGYPPAADAVLMWIPAKNTQE